MREKKCFKERMKQSFLGYFFAFVVMLGGIFGITNTLLATDVYAEPETTEVTSDDNGGENKADDEDKTDAEKEEEQKKKEEEEKKKEEEEKKKKEEEEKKKAAGENKCQDELESIGWLVCPTTGKIAEAVDWIYGTIEELLVVNPVEANDGSPIYEIWKYCRGVTNIVFIIFLLVVIYSQLTGLGINNYGIKKALPKLIVAAVLVNLSFLVCQLGIDLSNIVGNGLRGVFTSVQETVIANMNVSPEATDSLYTAYSEIYTAMAGGSILAVGAGVISFENGTIWMLIPIVLGAVVAVASGLITIALRQAVVALLVMIAPLAVVANILPNTEKWFKKWRDLLIQMLVFYPTFSLLFGASSLAGFAIIASAKDAFWLILGVAVQVFPLFFSWSLMKMSGTVLGTINGKLRGLGEKPIGVAKTYAESRKANRRANTLANGTSPSARLMQYMEKRKAMREEDTKNAEEIFTGKKTEYVQTKIAKSVIGDREAKKDRSSRITRNAKGARNYALIAGSATAHTEHVLSNYGDYFKKDERDIKLNEQSQKAWIDHWRATFQKEIDDENDINFMVDRYLEANKRDENNNPKDQVAFDRYVRSVVGPEGEERLIAKVIAQAAKVESKQRAEIHTFEAKYGHNGYNKREVRDWLAGYKTNDDGWAVDANGNRLKNADGTYVETVQGDAITKAPDKLVLYDKRDSQGIYCDIKDQEGNIVARVHRGIGDDGENHDNAAFIKEVMANYDIPIADPINNVYGILSGVKLGSINTPQGKNEIGLSRYSTTIGGAMKEYKANAAWAGAMFNSGIGNRQIKNSAQYAIWVLDSIKKTLKPGAYNTQNPASVEYLTAILDPDNWSKIFTEEELVDAMNINNELFGGEDWTLNENGEIVDYTPVENPTYEQRMNTLKRKLLYPAMKKILPAFDRLRTSNTADNQKPGTADAQYEFLKMVQDKWENNDAINFDPTLVDQDLQTEAKAFRQRKHDRNQRPIYADPRSTDRRRDGENLLVALEEAYDNAMIPEDLKHMVFGILSRRPRYSRALQEFEQRCNENPSATMSEMYEWFTDLDALVD